MLPATPAFSDEGAANHTRLCGEHGEPGVHLFVYGRQAFGGDGVEPRRFPARQTLEASQAIARQHGLAEHQVVYAQQHPDAIDAGVFHNDVIAVGNGPVLLYHELAFRDEEATLDALREKMEIVEDKRYSAEYHAPDKRSIANAIQVFFKDGSSTEQVAVEYPIGHRRRRAEGIPLLEQKFRANLATRFPASRTAEIFELCKDAERLKKTPVHRFMDLMVI